jgi:hypothetical protein
VSTQDVCICIFFQKYLFISNNTYFIHVPCSPLEKFCATIESQINAIEDRLYSVPYDLATGPTTKDGTYAVSLTRNSSKGSTSLSVLNDSHSLDKDVELGHNNTVPTESDPLLKSSYQNGV